ncbi:hypothetical protein ACTWPT_32625 [Nonomuraea sp. 3N208]|uniref:hypothetical protein n=1 Tax=Nonomuraea sp. 3N208 TaxID=3457421 RepID=UPI003FD2C297
MPIRGTSRPGQDFVLSAAVVAARHISGEGEAFDAAGYDASLIEVARSAGVGQGCLSRHVPDGVSLAAAVFEGNVAELGALAARPGTTLDEALDLIT